MNDPKVKLDSAVLDQTVQVEVSIKDLVKDAVKERAIDSNPKISREDYVKMAKLRINKIFKPKIQMLENRIEQQRTKYDDQANGFNIIEKAKAIAQKDFDIKKIELVKLAKMHDEAAGKINSFALMTFVNDLARKFTEATMTFSLCDNKITYIINTKDQRSGSHEVSLSSEIKEYYEKRKAIKSILDKLIADKDIMNKCFGKAITEITEEVELGLLENSISKNDEDVNIAKGINERLSTMIATNFLPAADCSCASNVKPETKDTPTPA